MLYLAPQYKEIEQALSLFAKENNLDEITVNSLIRGSVEVLELEMPVASTIVLDTENLSSTRSVKLRNIKVNFAFAIDTIFSIKSVCDAEGLGLILYILKAIVYLCNEMNITLSRKEALTVFALYRLRCADEKEIKDYVQRLYNNDNEFSMTLDEVKDSLDNLEKFGSAKKEYGKYSICESILIR